MPFLPRIKCVSNKYVFSLRSIVSVYLQEDFNRTGKKNDSLGRYRHPIREVVGDEYEKKNYEKTLQLKRFHLDATC